MPSTGTYLIVAAALGAGEVGNFTLTTTVGIRSDFDLLPISITTPSQTAVLEGAILRVDLEIDNPGPDPVPSGWTGEIRLSTDATIDAGDLLLTSFVEDNSIAVGSNTA